MISPIFLTILIIAHMVIRYTDSIDTSDITTKIIGSPCMTKVMTVSTNVPDRYTAVVAVMNLFLNLTITMASHMITRALTEAAITVFKA